MQVQIITFRIEGLTETQAKRWCSAAELAIAELPGLMSKTWLGSDESGFCGGVYFWEDSFALHQFRHSELYCKPMCSPYVEDVDGQDFAVHGEPSEVTTGLTDYRLRVVA